MLALAITVTIAAALATLMVSVSYGTSSEANLRSVVVRLKATTSRIDAALRGAARVLEHGDDYVVLWLGDIRANDAPNLSELRLIEHDRASGRLISHVASFPPHLSDEQVAAIDSTYSFSDNFRSITTDLKSGDYFPGTLWAEDIADASITTVGPDPQQARIAQYRVTVRSGGIAETSIGAAAIRNR